ncbi:MAG: dipicolinate synthase subunit B [Clostridia bacterium]|nr:dipicolinate synthase subunit B [Clostridia bacterium]
MRLGFAMCGSFCTFKQVIPQMYRLAEEGYEIFPIMSFNAHSTDTRFGSSASFVSEIEGLTGKKIISSIASAEPIGPKKLLDILLVAPATGNTIAKIAAGISDTPVTLAVKSHLRNSRPVVIAVSTNDALSGNAANIGSLLSRKGFYFVPFSQDDPQGKPCSAVADFTLIPDTVRYALEARQLQPLLR